jgi:hypothetical protein
MKKAYRTVLIAILVMLPLSVAASLAAETPAFTAGERRIINDYYKHLMETLAPGSIDRSTFPWEIEKTIVVGSRVPGSLEKKMEPLPKALESRLNVLSGEFRRYRLGQHVLLVRKTDLIIVDIVKQAGMK